MDRGTIAPSWRGGEVTMQDTTDSRAPWWRSAALWVGLALGCALLAWFRLGPIKRDTLWAEDARIFSMRAIDPSLLTGGIFTPLDGYTHAVPQLVASTLWAFVPIDAMAWAFTAAACLLVGAVAASVYFLTRDWQLNWIGRLLLALCTVLTPGLAAQSLGNLANLHWYLLWLTPFVLLARPRSWLGGVTLGIVAFFIFATEIQSVLFAPLLLWRITDRFRVPLAVGVVAGALVQGIGYLQGSPGRADGQPTLFSVVKSFLLQVPLTGLTGSSQAAGAAVAWTGWDIAVAATVPFVLAGFWASRTRRRGWAIVALFAAAAVFLWCVGYILNFDPGYDFGEMDSAQLRSGVPLLRYAVVPLLLVFGIAALAIGRSGRSERRSRWPLTVVATACTILLVAVFSFSYRTSVPPAGSEGPRWTSGVADARQQCMGKDDDEVIRILQVPAAPWWSVDVPCERLR
jgi:hypothetical protein